MQLRQLFVLLLIQFYLVKSASLTSRASNSRTESFEDSMTKAGSPYSIAVSETEEYVRFVPNQTQTVVWKDVKLGMNSSLFDCSLAPFNLTLNCFNGVAVAGDTHGCLTKTDDGWVYGVEDGRLVDEDTLPPQDTCCQSAADFCLMAECSDEPMTYCEAEARCLARGLQAASWSFHENVDTVDPTKLGTDEYYFWVNVYQEQDDVWKWQDDGSYLSDYVWCRIPNTTTTTTQSPTPLENCAAIHFTDNPHKIEYYRTQCTGTEVKCILCVDLNGTLPAC